MITYKFFFEFSLPTEILNLPCWKYEYYDLIEKKIRSCKIHSPYTHFITRGFTFKHDNDNSCHVRFNDTNPLMISNFYHKNLNSFMNYHSDFNTIFTFDWIKDYQWFGAGRALTYYFINETVVNRNVDINKFSADYYIKSKKGNGYTVGTVEERQALSYKKKKALLLRKTNYLHL